MTFQTDNNVVTGKACVHLMLFILGIKEETGLMSFEITVKIKNLLGAILDSFNSSSP